MAAWPFNRKNGGDTGAPAIDPPTISPEFNASGVGKPVDSNPPDQPEITMLEAIKLSQERIKIDSELDSNPTIYTEEDLKQVDQLNDQPEVVVRAEKEFAESSPEQLTIVNFMNKLQAGDNFRLDEQRNNWLLLKLLYEYHEQQYKDCEDKAAFSMNSAKLKWEDIVKLYYENIDKIKLLNQSSNSEF